MDGRASDDPTARTEVVRKLLRYLGRARKPLGFDPVDDLGIEAFAQSGGAREELCGLLWVAATEADPYGWSGSTPAVLDESDWGTSFEIRLAYSGAASWIDANGVQGTRCARFSVADKGQGSVLQVGVLLDANIGSVDGDAWGTRLAGRGFTRRWSRNGRQVLVCRERPLAETLKGTSTSIARQGKRVGQAIRQDLRVLERRGMSPASQPGSAVGSTRRQ
jgi:hypothetical protein